MLRFVLLRFQRLCERAHTKAYIKRICQSEAKVLCESAIVGTNEIETNNANQSQVSF